MFLSPYQTTACRTHVTKNIVEEIRRAHAQDNLTRPIDDPSVSHTSAQNTFLVGTRAGTKQFGQILTPLELDRPGDPRFVADARYCLSLDRTSQTDRVKAPLDYDRLMNQLSLVGRWWDGYEGRMDLLKISPIPGRVFAAFLAKKIANRFGLDLEHELIMGVVTAWYYFCLFHTSEELDQRAKDRAYNYITQWTGIPTSRVVSIVQDLKPAQDLAEYVSLLQTVIGGPVISDLTVGMLMSFVGTGWFDHTGRENMAVALEYPPTWIYMCVSSLDTRSFRRSDVANLVIQLAAKNGDQFARNFKLMKARV